MTHQETDPVVLSISDGVAVLRLNEPGSMNALSATIKQGMIELVPKVVADETVRAIVITGTGKAFCAGGDIRNMADRRPLAVRERMRTSHDWLELLMLGEKPVITIVNGVAAGAGLSLALIGDIILCADDAKFRAGFPGLGAVPDLGAIWTLPRAVGVPRAKDILLSNREVLAAEALSIGLVSRLLPSTSLMEEGMKLAKQLASGPSVSLGLTKSLMRKAFETDLAAFFDAEANAQVLAFSSEDFDEGVAAFLGKRKPCFTGR